MISGKIMILKTEFCSIHILTGRWKIPFGGVSLWKKG